MQKAAEHQSRCLFFGKVMMKYISRMNVRSISEVRLISVLVVRLTSWVLRAMAQYSRR